MKSASKFILLLAILLSVSCKPSPQKAEDYYDQISLPVKNVLVKEDKLIQIINADTVKDKKGASILKKLESEPSFGKHKELDLAYNNFKMQITTSLNTLKQIPDFDNKAVLKNTAIALLNTYDSIAQNEYAQLITITKIPASQYTNANDDKLLELTEIIDNKLQVRISAFTKEVKLFASDYKFKLAKDSI